MLCTQSTWSGGVVTPLILSLCTRRTWVFRFTPQSLYIGGNSTRNPLRRRFDGPSNSVCRLFRLSAIIVVSLTINVILCHMCGWQCSINVALKMSDRKPKRICKESSEKVKFKGWEVKLRLFLASALGGGEPYASASVPLGKGHQLNRRL